MAALAVAMVLPGIVAVAAGVHLYGSPCCSYGAAGIVAVAAGVHLYGSPCCSYGAAWYCCSVAASSSLWQPLL